jgi:hypothetical protein
LKGQRFQDVESIEKSNEGTETYFTVDVPKNVSNSGSIIELSGYVVKASSSKVTHLNEL